MKVAFEFIRYDKSKMIGILAGIVISIFLIGNQLGIFNSIIESMRGIIKGNESYTWLVHKDSKSPLQLQSLDTRIGREVLSIPGVKARHELVIGAGTLKLPNGLSQSCQIIGLELPEFNGMIGEVTDSVLAKLYVNGAVVLDEADRNAFGNLKEGDSFELSGHRVHLAGYAKGMRGFGNSNVVTTTWNARNLSGMQSTTAHAYLLELDTSYSSKAMIISSIQELIPNTKVRSGDVFATESMGYMMATSNIAASFGMLIFFAGIAGFVIVGLTTFSSVNDRIRDYGTLKAIGGTNSFLTKLILMQSFCFALIGFLISMLLLQLFKMALEGGRMEVEYSWSLISTLFIITLLISFSGSLFALRKIRKLEPSQIFRL